MQLEKNNHMALSLLCVVCDRNKRDRAEAVLCKRDTFFNLITTGRGTAHSRMENYLGIGEPEKAIILSMLASDAAEELLEIIDEKLLLAKPGHGISFLTKISLGCYHRPVELTDGANGGTAMQQEAAHSLIMVVLNRGYSEEVMRVARDCGATGGTVLHARSIGTAGMEKFFGVTIAPEKELLLIVAEGGVCCHIMGGIAEKAGPSTDASAISFSLPVTHVKGLHTASE